MPGRSFDRTYEELKHAQAEKLKFRGDSFDRTYEELKPRPPQRNRPGHPRF